MPTIYNKVVIDGSTLMDISDTTAVASDVAQGKYFYTANGTKTAGTASGGSSSATLITKTIAANGTYSAQDDSADGYSSVTVSVPSSGITPTGSINIITNGTHDVTNYASAVVSVSGGSTPSATQHTILFEFTDETTQSITGYWDSSFISDAITATTPTEYSSKTVDSASLDGVAWYTRPTETWETIYDNTAVPNADTPYNYWWLASLSDVYPTLGSVWRVTIDGTSWVTTARQDQSVAYGAVYIGNPKYTGGQDDGSGMTTNFYNAGWGAWTGDTEITNQEHTVKIERQVLL